MDQNADSPARSGVAARLKRESDAGRADHTSDASDSMSFAYLPLFTGDYLRDTRHLSPLRHGVYLLALMHCWDSKGPMPLDEQECAGICNCRSVEEIDALRYVLGRFFVRMDDGHYNKRIAEEVAKSEHLSKQLSKAGKASAAARRSKARQGKRTDVEHVLNTGSAKVEPRSVSPSPSPSPSPNQPQANLTLGEPPEPPRPSGASGEQATPAPKKRERKAKEAGPTSVETWQAYADAYRVRYGVQPVRNARVNAQLSQLVHRLGAEEAPGVARFYVAHRNALYVNAKHCTDLLLRDAEKLRTEWVTGQTTYRRDAVEGDRIAATGAMWDRIAQRRQEKPE